MIEASRLAASARVQWIGTGVYAQWQPCASCRRWAYCRGKRRDRLVCLECYDNPQARREKR